MLTDCGNGIGFVQITDSACPERNISLAYGSSITGSDDGEDINDVVSGHVSAFRADSGKFLRA